MTSYRQQAADWIRFCDAMDAHRREMDKIQAKNRRLRAEAEKAVQRALAVFRAKGATAS